MTSISCIGLGLAGLALTAQAQEHISHGRFTDVAIYAPTDEVQQFVLWLDGAYVAEEEPPPMLPALLDQGAMVARIEVCAPACRPRICVPSNCPADITSTALTTSLPR